MKLPDTSRYFEPGILSLRFICILLVVLLLHVFLVYLLMSSAPPKVSPRTSKTVDTVLIQRVIAPPKQPSQTQLQAPAPNARMPAPPSAVPSPEAVPSPKVLPSPEAMPRTSHQAPVIQAASTPPATVVAAPTVQLPPAPVATGPLPASIRLVCPTQVAPEMPRRALKEGIEGVVRAQIRIKDSRIVDVTILSGPRVFHAAVREAMMQYSCATGGAEVVATQDFNFKLE